MSRGLEAGRQDCPQCRTAVTKENIVVDLRSDRKSAAQPRRCPFHEDHNCDFIGTRQEVVEHKMGCPCDPNLCKSQRCKADLASVVHDKMILEQRVQELIRINEDHVRAASMAALAAKQALVSASMLSPENILTKAYGFDGAFIFDIDDSNKYSFAVKYRFNRNAPQEFKVVCIEANHNVSLLCHRRKRAVGPASAVQITFTLVSFEPTVAEDFKSEVTINKDANAGDRCGHANWLSSSTFKKYVKNGKFALGWKVTVEK